MFKALKYVYELGRRQAYTEILGDLGRLADSLPHNREGQLLRQPINETIDKLMDKRDQKGGKNE